MTPRNQADGASINDGFMELARMLGRALVNQLAILARLRQMHDPNNVAVETAAESVMGVLRELFAHRGSFTLTLIGDYFFIEGERIRYKVDDYPNFELLAAEFKRCKLGQIGFNRVVDARELVSFVTSLLDAGHGGGEAYNGLARTLGAAGVKGLATGETRAPKASPSGGPPPEPSRATRRAYVRVMASAKNLFDDVGQGRPADIRKLKRAVQSLVGFVYTNEPELIRLSAIRSRVNILTRHYANVAVLSLLMGKRLGLSKYQMGRLGIAALLHDIGRHNMPEDMVYKSEDPASPAWELFRRHPSAGVQAILKLKGLNEVSVSAIIVAYEHHRNLDGSGYPAASVKKDMNLFSRIVRVADNFDATTSSGIYGMIAMLPFKAVESMLNRSGQYFDPGILELFIAMVGVYPVGSLVILTDGRMGVVSQAGQASAGRPRVRLISSRVLAGGHNWEEVDTGGKDSSGNYKVDVAGALDPYQCGVDIYRYLFD